MITLLAISVTTFIVYKSAKYLFGIQLRLKPLVLCACCALLISFGLPRIIVGYAGLAGTLGIMAVFAIIFAYLVAYYDTYDFAGFDTHSTAVMNVAPESSSEDDDFDRRIVVNDEVSDIPLGEYPAIPEMALDIMNDCSAMQPPVTQQCDRNNPECPLETVSTAPQPQPKSTSIDDLLEFAFSQIEENNPAAALTSFRTALKMYPASEAAPFIIVEIGNILKNKGAYDEAIQTFSEGRSLAAVHSNPLLEQEFITTIAYLRIIKNTLVQNHLGYIPFHKIPTDILQAIDTEFAEWRKFV